MKKYCLLFFIAFLPFISFSQKIKKLIADLDSAYYHNDYSKAKILIQEIIPLTDSKLKNPTDYIAFLSTCGSVYYNTNEFEEAENYFLMASEKAKMLLGEADYHYNLALFNLAACYKEEGRYAEAEPLYLKSMPVLANTFGQSSIEYTRCFYSVASLYIDMGRFSDAEGMCAAAVNFYKEILGQSSKEYLSALGSMGIIYQGLGKYDKAEEIFIALLNYFNSLEKPDNVTVQTLFNNLGELYRNMGDYEKAEPYLLKAVNNSETNSISSATALNNLALVQKALGKYSEAEVSYKKSINIYKFLKKTNHPDYTNPVNNLGELYRIMGRFQEAYEAFDEVIQIRKKLLGTEHPNYANALNNIALLEYAIGNNDDAEKHLLECKDIYKRILGEKDKFYANCLNNLASIYKEKGELQKAKEMYTECLNIYKETYGETSDKYGIYLGGLAGVYRQLKEYDKAIDITNKSLKIIKNKLGENHYDYILTEYNLAETYRESGDFKQAEKYYLHAIQGYLFLIEKYFPSLSEKEKTSFYYTVSIAFETFNSFVIQMQEKFPKENHDLLIAKMYDNQLIIKSLLLKEASKIKIQVATSENPELKKDYQDLLKMREIIVQQYRMNSEEMAESGIDLSILVKNANELEQKIATVSATSQVKTDNDNKSWKDIQHVLNPGEYAVEIVRTQYYDQGKWTDSIYYTASIINKTCSIPTLIIIRNGNELENKILPAYQKFIRSKKEDNYSYDAFWLPLKATIGTAKKIYFSADGVYQQINIYTLKNSFSKKYLIEESNIVLLTNTKDLIENFSEAISNTAEIFSYPDYDLITQSEIKKEVPLSRYGFTYLPELPGTKTEADTITHILCAKNWKVNEHLQADATENNIKRIDNPKILHIATHGFFLQDINEKDAKTIGIQSEVAKQNPLLRSGLMLAGAASIARDSITDKKLEDGILTAYEAVNLNLGKTDLVILSACETGLGEVRNGQGVYGLQRAFMVAGAKSVIMSLWVVDDFATQELMSNFYREWLKDASSVNKQKAFRIAQLKLKEKYPEPYFWGAFVMLGK